MNAAIAAQSHRRNLVLTGGGTAGHVWPHFAVIEDPLSPLAAEVQSGGVGVFYFGSDKGIEKELVCTSGRPWTFVGISTGKLRRYFSWQNFTDPFRVLAGFFQAFWHLGQVRASCVFSKGGFVAAPVVWAAWLRRIPVVIHESDATPALATKLTLPFATRALITFQETAQWLPARFRSRILAMGLPMRSTLFNTDRSAAVSHFTFDPARKTLLIFGGSLGAEALNKRMAEVLPELGARFNVLHIVGKGKTFSIDAGPFYRQFEFLKDEMSLAYAATDLAICRAGASSIFELAAARIPMILVPLGLHQSRGDQIVNAKLFAKQGWCEWVDELQLDGARALALVGKAMAELPERKQALSSAPHADAAAKTGALLLELMERYVATQK